MDYIDQTLTKQRQTRTLFRSLGRIVIRCEPIYAISRHVLGQLTKKQKTTQIIYFLDKLTLNHVRNNYHHVTIMSYYNGDVLHGRDGFPSKFIL